MLKLWAQVKRGALILGALLIGLLALFKAGQGLGAARIRDKLKAKAAEKALAQVNNRKAIEDEVDDLSDTGVLDSLRQQGWVRKSDDQL